MQFAPVGAVSTDALVLNGFLVRPSQPRAPGFPFEIPGHGLWLVIARLPRPVPLAKQVEMQPELAFKKVNSLKTLFDDQVCLELGKRWEA